jgi:tRNA wybutosine-synthesizing protein 2
MFSSGNVNEKARVASFRCAGETVVDMFAGIGYFTVPILVRAGAAHVHAMDHNADAVECLRRNLAQNHVADRATVYLGDNRCIMMCYVCTLSFPRHM